MSRAESNVERCSFCEKARPMVDCLIAGPPGIYICNECIALCDDILAEELGARSPQPRGYRSRPAPKIGADVCAHTLRVTRVRPGGPAAHAGVQEGDVIEHDVPGLRAALADAQLDGCLEVRVRRGEHVETLVLKLPGDAPGKSVEI